MSRVPLIVLVALVTASIALIGATSADLPARAATHFGPSGAADGWAPREVYVALMIGAVVALPLLIVAFVGGLPRVAPRLLNLPHRDYWLAPARREETLRWLFAHGCVLACLLVAFLAALHLVIVQSNRAAQPALALLPFGIVLATFLVAVAAWSLALFRRFRLPRGRPGPRQDG
jgi:uncharacterized membrane protein